MSSSIELADRTTRTESTAAARTTALATNDNAPDGAQLALPPTDSGHQAWLCLAGCFTANVLIWGFAFSFGVLQEHYRTHAPFAARPAGIAAIGTTATGLMYLLMPVYFAVLQRRPRWRRRSTAASVPLLAAALVGASFAHTVPQLVATQGALFALAGNALVVPTITYLDEWFVRRKGLAIGIMWAGDGAGAVLLPLALHALLARCGFRWTLRAVAALMVLVTAPMLAFLRPRLPEAAAPPPRPVDLAFLRAPLFWALQAFNVVQALGYFLPTNYLPSIAEALGAGATLGSLTLLVVNAAAVVGCVAVGALVDRFSVTAIVVGVSAGAGVAVLAVLGFAVAVAPLFGFCLLYGLTAGSYSTAWGGMVKEIQRRHDGADANLVFGFLAAGRGVGSVISGPLSEALLGGGGVLNGGTGTAYQSQYGPIIIFAGCTALVGGCSWFVRRAGLI